MPLVIHPRVRKTIGRIAALTCAAVFVSSGAAFAAQCPTQSAKQKFSKWGDSSSYFLLPGGSFEGTPADLVADRSTLTGEHLAAYVGS